MGLHMVTHTHCMFNSLWPTDTILRHRTWSTLVQGEAHHMRSDRIGHHGNRRWDQIPIQIQVYNAERPQTCRGAIDRPSDNAAWPLVHKQSHMVVSMTSHVRVKTMESKLPDEPICFGIVVFIIFILFRSRYLTIGARSMLRFVIRYSWSH